jgi:hypothetical protein
MDAFDLYWQWANKPMQNQMMLDGRIYNPIMKLSEENRRDRAKVNAAVAAYVWPDDVAETSIRPLFPPLQGA